MICLGSLGAPIQGAFKASTSSCMAALCNGVRPLASNIVRPSAASWAAEPKGSSSSIHSYPTYLIDADIADCLSLPICLLAIQSIYVYCTHTVTYRVHIIPSHTPFEDKCWNSSFEDCNMLICSVLTRLLYCILCASRSGCAPVSVDFFPH